MDINDRETLEADPAHEDVLDVPVSVEQSEGSDTAGITDEVIYVLTDADGNEVINNNGWRGPDPEQWG